MMVVVYLFNWVSWLFDESYLVFFLDLVIKIAISFIPDAYVLMALKIEPKNINPDK